MTRRSGSMEVCQDILEHLQTEPDLLQRVITGDESWIFEYDLETKHQSLQWKCLSSLRPKKAKQLRSKIKLMLITFFNTRGIVHKEFLPQGQTINQHVYKEILQHLLHSVCMRRGMSCGRTMYDCFTRTIPQLTMP